MSSSPKKQNVKAKKIKANCDNYESPTQFIQKGEDDTFIPDATGVLRGKKIYIEVALKTDNLRRRISKWKLLSTLAAMRGGKFYLLAPKGHKTFTERVVKKYLLQADVIYLKNT